MHRYCSVDRGVRTSPYLQELIVYAGHLDVYVRSAEMLTTMLRISVSPPSVYRLCDHYGQQLSAVLDQPQARASVDRGELVYAQLDGSMILTHDGWREVKLGRVFLASAIETPSNAERGQHISCSSYTAHLGTAQEFTQKFEHHIDAYRHVGKRLVFLSDGAQWITQWIKRKYPDATEILDFYHAVEYLGRYGQLAISDAAERQRWIAAQKALLLAGRVSSVIAEIDRHAQTRSREVKEQARVVIEYYRRNARRMRYDEYTRRGLYIGSGAIESAHRTVIQKRMKLSGQRWSIDGASYMLNLRACSMSGNWHLVRSLICATPSVA